MVLTVAGRLIIDRGYSVNTELNREPRENRGRARCCDPPLPLFRCEGNFLGLATPLCSISGMVRLLRRK
jgi:hypothetical protein